MIIKFGSFTLDGAARLLFRDGEPIHVSPKAFDLLTVLVARRPDAVSKSDLHTVLWPDSFVADVNLAVLVAEVRTALADDARTPRFIRTVTRYGYAFCGDATEAARPTAAAPSRCWIAWGIERAMLHPGENLVGRDPGADVRIDAVGVSRRHALIRVSDNGVIVEDLASKNGTYVNDARVTAPVRVGDGSEIRLGPIPIRFHQPDATMSTQTFTRASRHQEKRR